VHFETGNSTILPEYRPFLQAAGNRIARLIGELRGKAQPGIKYLIIIEGMASRDGYANNFELSYQRALALYRLWQEMKIGFDSDVVEVIVAGSGTEGVGRYGPADETRNQRFLIQILPKVGAEGWR
jgi:flagellar motor protein MotB